MIHVYPLNDEQPHETHGDKMCPCNPRVEYKHPETGEMNYGGLVIHNAFDCREVVEEAEKILDEVQ